MNDAEMAELRRIRNELERLKSFEVDRAQGTGVLAQFLAPPNLRGFWPMSSVDNAGAVYDLSGQGRTLTNAASATFGATTAGMPYVSVNGSTQWLYRADEAGLDVTGALTLAGWFNPAALATQGLITKSDGATSAGSAFDLIIRTPGSVAELEVHNGSNRYYVQSASALSQSVWQYIAGRFTPSTELALFVGSTKATNTTSIPASLNNVAAPFNIGAFNSAAGPFNGSASLCFLCAAALSDATIIDLYQSSRALFGV